MQCWQGEQNDGIVASIGAFANITAAAERQPVASPLPNIRVADLTFAETR
jgi:hypothetical protein